MSKITPQMASDRLSGKQLSDAYHILFGNERKKSWSEIDKAMEMRSILSGLTEPCVPFENWINLIYFLESELKQTT